ncbi:poly-gamma-glutamate synthase PgsB [Kitasatospora camelliae]|uniref:Poly-gamma-glutamate synthase PgsB n=1 Tax=Kitasatospora camelliae TaxID=3156397 RepID=A0AAU8JUC4_9ACTN
MLFLYSVLVICCVGLLIAGIVEQRRHYAALEQIPVRVLVNGIRGKSSITRLCAGALRGGDLVTVAKTTGTAARFIHPDATEEPVFRKFGIANVAEQIGIVRRAAAYRPDALVIECMAVMPPLQEVNQTKLIRSTIGVLCNVREDHLAEMGPTLDDVARSLSRSMPVGGVCVTAEQDRRHILQEEADKRSCELIVVDPETVSDEELRGFSWFTFKENVAIALAVAELMGVDRQTALRGMWEAPPDPGVLSVERYRTPEGKRLRFANVFAANDPESTLMNVQQLLDLGAIHRPLNVVINCRPDRVERNGQMGSIVPDLDPDTVFLIGHPTKSARDGIPAGWNGRIVDLGGDRRDPAELTEALLHELGPDTSLVAVGNIHGQGELFLEELAALAPDDEPAAPAHARGGHPVAEDRPAEPVYRAVPLDDDLEEEPYGAPYRQHPGAARVPGPGRPVQDPYARPHAYAEPDPYAQQRRHPAGQQPYPQPYPQPDPYAQQQQHPYQQPGGAYPQPDPYQQADPYAQQYQRPAQPYRQADPYQQGRGYAQQGGYPQADGHGQDPYLRQPPPQAGHARRPDPYGHDRTAYQQPFDPFGDHQ